LLQSTDGGQTWHLTHVVADRVAFATSRLGWASSYDEGTLLRTDDGGKTWHRVRSPCGGQVSTSFVSARRGWLLCAGPPGAGTEEKWLFATRDGGASWHRLGSPSAGGYANGILFVSATRGWIWESRGPSLRTDDAGRTWRPLLVTAADKNEVSMMSAAGATVWQLLERNISTHSWRLFLRRSTDRGTTWDVVRTWAP
jgi:photosystem II stability/assembly factor-like uncharacterized protein